jgi:hypothetical protein
MMGLESINVVIPRIIWIPVIATKQLIARLILFVVFVDFVFIQRKIIKTPVIIASNRTTTTPHAGNNNGRFYNLSLDKNKIHEYYKQY